MTSWLQDCLIKKKPQAEHLANCSTMKNIIREAAKLLYKYDGITPTRQEKQEAAREHAKYIFDSVQYSIQTGSQYICKSASKTVKDTAYRKHL